MPTKGVCARCEKVYDWYAPQLGYYETKCPVCGFEVFLRAATTSEAQTFQHEDVPVNGVLRYPFKKPKSKE